MNRDDRLFATIGGSVVTAAATVFLVFAGGITGPIEDRPTIRVAPNPVVEIPKETSDIVPARFEEPAPAVGDELVRSLVRGISAHPGWASWLVTDDLVRRFVASVEAVADGYSPRGELEFASTNSPFLVREDEGRLVIAAGTFRRYNLAVEVFGSVDARAVVEILGELEPAINEARQDIAWHRGDFQDRLRQAVDHLLEVDIPTGAIEVERRSVTYAFAADEHERLSDAQRQLLRMGWENATAVQAKLREVREAFNWPEGPELAPADLQIALMDEEEPAASEPVVVAEAVTSDPGSEEITLVQTTKPILTPILGADSCSMTPPVFEVGDASPGPVE